MAARVFGVLEVFFTVVVICSVLMSLAHNRVEPPLWAVLGEDSQWSGGASKERQSMVSGKLALAAGMLQAIGGSHEA